MVGDVDEQVVLEEALDLGEVLDADERLARGGGERYVGDHDTGLVVVGDGVLGELTNLTNTELFIGEELDPDGAAVGGRIGVGLGSGRSKLPEHGVAGSR